MSTPFEEAIARFNAVNAEDPTSIEVGGEPRPKELVAAERLETWVKKVAPEAGEALLLASRCQHLKRFAFPRSEYPEGRVGYLKWRKELSRKHADLACEVLAEAGVAEALIAQVRTINLKEGIKANPDTQAMEDALCLSFLAHDFAAFAAKYDDDKVVDIVQKTWRKMSERGHELALSLPFDERSQKLIERALS
jgi:hypothetical protein